jgi:hypothetical protein
MSFLSNLPSISRSIFCPIGESSGIIVSSFLQTGQTFFLNPSQDVIDTTGRNASPKAIKTIEGGKITKVMKKISIISQALGEVRYTGCPIVPQLVQIY